MLERMCARWFALNSSTPLTCLPLDAPSAGVQATSTVTISAAPSAAGTVTFYIAGHTVPVAIGASDTVTTVASALVTAITAKTILPVTATNTAGAVTLTAKHKGVSGNDILVMHNYRGVNGGEVMPAGLGITYASNGFLTGGSGVPDWTAAIAALGDFAYEYVAMPFADTGSLAAWGMEYGFSASGRWGISRQSYGVVLSATRGTYSDHIAFGPNQNYPTISIMAMEKRTAAPAWEVAAAYAAKAAEALSADPARPLQTLQLEGILPALPQDRFAKSEINAIAAVGLAIQGTVGGIMQILREQTTYQVNLYGQSDNSYELLTTLTTIATLNRRGVEQDRRRVEEDRIEARRVEQERVLRERRRAEEERLEIAKREQERAEAERRRLEDEKRTADLLAEKQQKEAERKLEMDRLESARRAEAIKQADMKRQQVETATKAAGVLKDQMYECATREIGNLVRSGEGADVLASATMTLCSKEVDKALDGLIEARRIETGNYVGASETDAIKVSGRTAIRERVMAEAVKAKAARASGQSY